MRSRRRLCRPRPLGSGLTSAATVAVTLLVRLGFQLRVNLCQPGSCRGQIRLLVETAAVQSLCLLILVLAFGNLRLQLLTQPLQSCRASLQLAYNAHLVGHVLAGDLRSEERRVGKE